MWGLQNNFFKVKYSKNIGCLVICVASLVACGREDYTPKPKGYNRIDLPPAKYQPLAQQHPYWFEYSAYAKILRDSSRTAMPHWLNIYYPQFQANVQLTYRPVNNDKQMLNKLLEDARTLTIKHQIKAESIEGGIIKTENGMNVNVAELTGEVPTQFQFYVTDSTKHFFRGALYFRTATANDSLAPVINYIKKDMVHLLNTLKWTE
ncbi:gliding motility lipoprotein GldD [Adhaeribacter rhizoryzae]|uniref:Gliding motility lipoprotein GldD n=1 Tax=Adhaeribacter rhizoryzae TaxID=2607907 RepID=A0A5M6DD85_9BACT|nr:gliding motility lipoprotein GldD [Adhaeribacter rhizoryzae]KAA5544029.1 gliding motility lipoprotein GldD [Adhaeribacter rhizoryzae]